MERALQFAVLKRDGDAGSCARLGRVDTAHGGFDTPAFMPVGTQATVKGLLPASVEATGAQIILGNTYHLMLRPGSGRVKALGGLHRFMRWERPILTDSGGFQVFSLADLNRIGDDGVSFKSHLDGSTIELTPERSMAVQHDLGSDIMMAFDDCPPGEPGDAGVGGRGLGVGDESARIGAEQSAALPHSDFRVPTLEHANRVRLANERTLRWLDRCVKYHRESGRDAVQALFGIVQGGTDLAARARMVDATCAHDLPGFAIGGVAVGEGPADVRAVVRHTAPLLPADRPRYLMGVGYPSDIVHAVRSGVDMFDCVLPTRNGRNAFAFTAGGVVRLRNAKYAEDPRPIEEGCDCVACSGTGGAVAFGGVGGGENAVSGGGHFSRAYLRHLFTAGEMLGPILVSLHNLRVYQRLMLDIRTAIRDDAWLDLYRRWPSASPAPGSATERGQHAGDQAPTTEPHHADR